MIALSSKPGMSATASVVGVIAAAGARPGWPKPPGCPKPPGRSGWASVAATSTAVAAKARRARRRSIGNLMKEGPEPPAQSSATAEGAQVGSAGDLLWLGPPRWYQEYHGAEAPAIGHDALLIFL